jgi:SAM-dependent methyltransferase
LFDFAFCISHAAVIYTDYAPIYHAIGQGAFAEGLVARLLGALPAPPRRALDLACGTGAATLALAAAGAECVGVDRSPQMLAIARARARDRQLPVRFVEADIRDLGVALSPPPAPFDLVTCLYDSLNYLTDDGDLALVFAAVAPLLRPGGRLIFDLNTEHEFLTWDESDQVVHDAGGMLVYNRLDYSPADRLAEGRIVWFVRDDDERWWRGEERHVERAWRDDEVHTALAAAGLQLLTRRSPLWEPASAHVSRIVYEAGRP